MRSTMEPVRWGGLMAVCLAQGQCQAALQPPWEPLVPAHSCLPLCGHILGEGAPGRAAWRRQAPSTTTETGAEALRTEGPWALVPFVSLETTRPECTSLGPPFLQLPRAGALPVREVTGVRGVVAGGTHPGPPPPSKRTHLLGACAVSTQGHQPKVLGAGF